MAQLKANKRKDAGKGAARTHRREGRVPAILYGHGEDSVSLTVDRNGLDRLVHSISIENTIVDLDVEGGGYKVLIREIQRHPVRKDFVHVDFFHVAMDEKIHLEIPVVIVGTAEGVKNKGGILDHQLREIEVYCLPGNIPEKIEVDVSALDIGESIHVSDLDLGDVDVETDLDRTVVAVLAPTVAAEPEEAEAGEELAEPQLVGREREEAGEEEESE
jgi:large subunit ribosomal protein L25